MATDSKDTTLTLGPYKILGGQELPRLGGGTAPVFAAQQANGLSAGTADPLIALVGGRDSFFRTTVADRYKSIVSPHLVRLMEWGVIDWHDGRQRVALVMQKPQESSLQDIQKSRRKAFSENDALTHILPPLIKALRELADHQLVHGAIRPANIYLGSNGAVTLGECLSAPPFYEQDISALTVENAIASPIGRGSGAPSDDIYSLGVTLMTLVLGVNPMLAGDPDAVIAEKIEKGSCAAFVGRHALGNGLMELARGLLDDDPRQRWSLETLEHWLGGKRLVSGQVLARPQVARPLVISGVEHWDPRSIALAFSRNVPEAMRLIGNDELIKWIKRTLRDPSLAERIADAVNMPMLSGKLGSYESRLVARVVMALHPSGPIRYQGQALMPDAIGQALARTLMAGESPQTIAEVIVAQLPLYWYNIQPDFDEDHVGPIKTFEQARFVLEQTVIGAGIERCLYELSANTAYAADGFDKFLILDSRQFVLALEIVSASASKSGYPITRHAAAFLATRDSQVGNRMLTRIIKAASEAEKALGNLQILAAVQKHNDLAKLPALCAWFETLLQPAMDRLHNRKSRETFRTELHKAAETGNLSNMLVLIENAAIYQRDREGLHAARREYMVLDAELKGLNQELSPASRLHRAVGREAASVVSGLLAAVLATILLVFRIGQG